MNEDLDFEKLVKDLQKKIEQDEEKTYSKKVIEEYRNPSNFGFIKDPDTSGRIKGPCGDTIIFDLKIKDKKISDVRFWTDGCSASIACGNMLAKMVTGKTLIEAKKVTSKQLLYFLDGLPTEHHHCTLLAVNVLRKSIETYYK